MTAKRLVRLGISIDPARLSERTRKRILSALRKKRKDDIEFWKMELRGMIQEMATIAHNMTAYANRVQKLLD